ncbi:MAG TPA: bacteriohemerythrin [Nitrospirota bacterium]|nr:bacteriohemerythrin [Nitrospirota bacterium]
MSLQWSDNLASGSDEIDSQHKELITRVNSLLGAFTKGTIARQEVAKIVQYLTEYVVYHFGTEEKQMAKYGYSSISAHKSQHEQFVKSFLKLKDRLLMEGINEQLAADTKDLVVDWLINHIKYSDRALGLFLKHKI